MIIAHHVDRVVADLRHDRAVELRPRRDGHVRRLGAFVLNSITGLAHHPRRRCVAIVARRAARRRASSTACGDRCVNAATEPHLDDDRVDRHRAGHALLVPVPVRRRPQGATSSTPLQTRSGLGRPDRPAAADAVHHRRCRSLDASSAVALFLLQGTLRQGDPGGRRTTPTWRRRAASTPTG